MKDKYLLLKNKWIDLDCNTSFFYVKNTNYRCCLRRLLVSEYYFKLSIKVIIKIQRKTNQNHKYFGWIGLVHRRNVSMVYNIVREKSNEKTDYTILQVKLQNYPYLYYYKVFLTSKVCRNKILWNKEFNYFILLLTDGNIKCYIFIAQYIDLIYRQYYYFIKSESMCIYIYI